MQTRSEETRTNILQAALTLFARLGYEAASVEDICAEAGVSKGAFYHHFPTKQAVFLQLLHDWLDGLDAQFTQARQDAENAAQIFMRMTAAVPGIFRDADQRLPMFLEFWAQASRDEAVWQATIAPYRRYRDYFASLIEQGIAEGVFRPVEPQAAAQLIVALAVGMLLQGLLDPQEGDWQVITAETLKIVMNGLAAQKE
jgi:AcrR family transcriptional regulator